MRLELHHVNILTPDVEGSIAFYRDRLGMCLAARHYQEGLFDIAFLRERSASTGFAIELVGPPFVGWMKEMYQQYGPMMDHFSFVTDDVDYWHEKLKARGCDIVMPPEPFLTVEEMYLRDACGVIVEIMSFLDPGFEPAVPPPVPGDGGLEYRLHHISILCHDIRSLERFYTDELGLTTVLEVREQGYIFMADAAFLADKDRAAPTIEIMGPPGIEPREAAFLQRYGPAVDHLCFTVDDVDAAHEELAAQGIQFDLEPVDYGGTRMAFFKDPNGVDIELLPPVPRGVLSTS